LMYDPQTSGGLLVAVDQNHSEALDASLRSRGVMAHRIGTVERPKTGVAVVLAR